MGPVAPGAPLWMCANVIPVMLVARSSKSISAGYATICAEPLAEVGLGVGTAAAAVREITYVCSASSPPSELPPPQPKAANDAVTIASDLYITILVDDGLP